MKQVEEMAEESVPSCCVFFDVRSGTMMIGLFLIVSYLLLLNGFFCTGFGRTWSDLVGFDWSWSDSVGFGRIRSDSVGF